MAYSQTVTDRTLPGIHKVVWGTYNAASVATGELDPGIKSVGFLTMQPYSATVLATGNSIDETMPFTVGNLGASKLTIDTATSETGVWLAIGKG